MARIFISHSSANNAEAIALRDWLQSEGWDDVFLDLDPERGIVAGERWERALNEAASRCEAVIFLVTRAWLASRWCLKELNLAHRLNKRLFGVLIEDIPIAEVPPDLTSAWQLVNLASGSDHQLFRALMPDKADEAHVTFSTSGLTRLKGGLTKAGLDARFFAWPPAEEPNRPPYRGLKPLEAEDAGIFFGREAPVVEALDRLRGLAEAASPRFLVILGASGAGKSSFLRAGLLPRLNRDDRNFLPLPIIRPDRAVLTGETGLVRSLDAAFQAQGSRRARAEVKAAIDGGAQTLVPLLASLAESARPPSLPDLPAPKPPALVLSIDQGEELFLAEGADEAEKFLALLKDLLTATTPDVITLVTIRSDSYERLQMAKPLEGVKQDTMSLPPVPQGSYADIIEGPVRRLKDTPRALKIEPALTQALLTDIATGGAKDALPLLAFTLERLYEDYGGDGNLRLSEYEELGRIKGSIEAAVESALRSGADSRTPQDRAAQLAVLRRAFIPWLAGIDPETGSPRRRVARLSEIPEGARPLVQLLVEQRLLATDVAKGTGEVTIEPAHEALLRQWGLLQTWLVEDSAALAALESVKRAARDWEASGKDPSWLTHGGGRLEDAERLRLRPDLAGLLGPDDWAYLAACRARESEEKEREEQRRKRELEEARKLAEAQKKVAQRTRVGLIVASVFAVGALGAAWFGFDRARLAREQTAVAEGRKKEAETANKTVGLVQRLGRHTSDIGTRPQRSLLLSVHAATLGDDGQSGKRLGALDGLQQQLRVTGGRPLTGHEKSTRVAAFSSDGRWLATGSDEGTILLWNMADVDPTRHPILLGRHGGAVHGLGFSPDGTWLVSGGADGGLRFWRRTPDGASPGPVFSGREHGPIQAFSISPNGDWLAFGTQNGNVCIWKLSADGPAEAPCDIGKQKRPVTKVQFSPKGRWLATAEIPNTDWKGEEIRLWDLSADFPHSEPKSLRHNDDLTEPSVQAFAFSKDETRLALTLGYQAQIWDLTQQDPASQVVGRAYHDQWITAVDFSPDGRWLATGSIDTNVKLWDLTDPRSVLLNGHSATVRSVVFSDDGKWLVTAGDDGRAYLWDFSGPRTIPGKQLRGHDGPVTGVVFSPEAGRRHLVTLGEDQLARLWTIPDATTEPIVLRGHKGIVVAAALSSDGKWIASSGVKDHELLIWSVEDPRQPVHRLPLTSYATEIAFSANGRWLAAAVNEENIVRLWSFPDMSKIALELPQQATTGPLSLGFSPDGQWLVSGAWDQAGTLNIWDVSGDTPSSTPRHQCQQGAQVRGLDFSADGQYAATGEYGVNAHLWNLRAANPCDSRQTFANGGTAVQIAISPDARWAATANFQPDSKGRLWDLRTGTKPKLAAEVPFTTTVMQSAFSNDQRWVAFGAWDNSVKVLDLRKQGSFKTEELSGHTGRVLSVAFSPDSRFLVTAGEDRTARVWNPEDSRQAPVVLRGHEGPVRLVGFSRDSRLLVTRSDDETIMLWHVGLSDLVDIACRTASRQLTVKEVADIFGEDPAVRPCVDQPPSTRLREQ